MRTVEVILVNGKGETKTVVVQSNNIPCAARNATMRNPGWKFKSAKFVGPLGTGRRSLDEIHSAVMQGRNVSASELSAYVRSRKGMQTIAMMRGGSPD